MVTAGSVWDYIPTEGMLIRQFPITRCGQSPCGSSAAGCLAGDPSGAGRIAERSAARASDQALADVDKALADADAALNDAAANGG